jgi:hypothetical protein
MDLIFGTYVCPDHEPDKFGIKEEFPESYAGQMIQPLIPSQEAKIINAEKWTTNLIKPKKKIAEPEMNNEKSTLDPVEKLA